MATDRNRMGEKETLKPITSADIPADSSIYGLRYISWAGGGVKGLGHWGAYKRLVETGVWPNIEEVAGTSAGSIFALFTALGCSVEEVFDEMMAVNYTALQDRDTPGFIESSGIKPILTFGQDIDPLAAAKKLLASKKKEADQRAGLGEVLGTAELLEDVSRAIFGSDLGLWKGDALVQLVTRILVRKTKDPNLTFEKLARLHSGNPTIFKKLTVVGANLSKKNPQQQKEYYTADDPKFKNMRIVDAIRISMSIPIAYRAVTTPITEEEQLAGKGDVRVDGGAFENQPDVFNQGKYYTPNHEAPANPQVFAVSFADPKKEETDRLIQSSLGVIQALAQSKMTEVDLRNKYGNHIAYVDPKGVGTLDFDASEQQKIALANSGSVAVDQAFRNILAAEKQKKLTVEDYEKMPIDELIRRRVALDHSLAEKNELLKFENQKKHKLTQEQIKALQEEVSDIPVKQLLISKAIAKKTYSPQEAKEIMAKRQGRDAAYEFLPSEIIAGMGREKIVITKFTEQEIREKEEQEKARLQRRLTVLGVVGPTVEELQQYCEKGLSELKAREEEVQSDVEKFEWMEMALQWRKAELEERLKDQNLKEELKKRLHDLQAHQEIIRDIHLEIEQLRSEERSNPKMSPKEYLEGINAKEELLKEKKNERDLFFKGILQKYDNVELISDLLSEIREQAITNISYDIPLDTSNFINELQEQISDAREGQDHLRKKQEVLHKTRHNLKRQLDLLKGNKNNAEYYNNMKDFKMDLDAALRSQLSWTEMKYANRLPVVDKLARHWDERPTFRNNIMAGLIKGLAFFGFTLRMTLGLGFLTMPVAYAIRRFSGTPETRRRADRFITAMSMPDFDKVRKFRAFANKTGEIIGLLDKNYRESREQETTYLYQLFSEHFKNSGLKFEEVFLRQNSETDKAYADRVKILKKKFSKLVQQEPLYRAEDKDVNVGVTMQVEQLKLNTLGTILDSQDKGKVMERKRSVEQAVLTDSNQQVRRLVAQEVILTIDRKLEILEILDRPFSKLDKKQIEKLIDYGVIQNSKVQLSADQISEIKQRKQLTTQEMIHYFESLEVLKIKVSGDKLLFWGLVHEALLNPTQSASQNKLRNLYLNYILEMKTKFPPELQEKSDRIKKDFRGNIDRLLLKAEERGKTNSGRVLLLSGSEEEEKRLVELYDKILGLDSKPQIFQKHYAEWLSPTPVSKQASERKQGKEAKEALKLFVQYHRKLRGSQVIAGQKLPHHPSPQ